MINSQLGKRPFILCLLGQVGIIKVDTFIEDNIELTNAFDDVCF
jgi:hypothetical protein